MHRAAKKMYIKNSDENSIVKHFLIVDYYISITETNSDFNVFCMNIDFYNMTFFGNGKIY